MTRYFVEYACYRPSHIQAALQKDMSGRTSECHDIEGVREAVNDLIDRLLNTLTDDHLVLETEGMTITAAAVMREIATLNAVKNTLSITPNDLLLIQKLCEQVGITVN